MLLATLLVYTCATTTHFIHNGLSLARYPDMPDWISRTGVILTLMGVLAVGAVGYVLYHYGLNLTGLILIGVYAALGFDGLAHDSLASFSSHSPIMNFTILFAVSSAGVLVIALLKQFVSGFRDRAMID